MIGTSDLEGSPEWMQSSEKRLWDGRLWDYSISWGQGEGWKATQRELITSQTFRFATHSAFTACRWSAEERGCDGGTWETRSASAFHLVMSFEPLPPSHREN